MKHAFALILALALTACGPTVTTSQRIPVTVNQTAAIKSAVAYRLKDPNSAQFRNIRGYARTHTDGSASKLYCGEVNGKNVYGAYVGFRWFHGDFTSTGYRLNGIAESDTNYLFAAVCKSY